MPLEIPVSAAALESIAAEHGTPYQLYDEASMRANVRSLIDTFSAAFPGFRQFFAVKALPNPAILRLLIDEGCGLDCSSVSELFIAKKLGVKGSDVMYTSNYTAADDLGFGKRIGRADWLRGHAPGVQTTRCATIKHAPHTRSLARRSDWLRPGSPGAVRAAPLRVQSQGGVLQFGPGRGTSAVVVCLLSVLSPRGRRGRRIVPSTQGAPFSTVFHARSSLSLYSLARSLARSLCLSLHVLTRSLTLPTSSLRHGRDHEPRRRLPRGQRRGGARAVPGPHLLPP